MGGDGGTIGASRLYMRGAGTADHTADAARRKAPHQSEVDRQQLMTHCALTGSPLDFAGEHGGVVACPYGRLYNRESALEALLARRSGGNSSSNVPLGNHVRGMKDLYPARFETENKNKRFIPVCPITRIELNGSQQAILLVSKKKKIKKSKDQESAPNTSRPNVFSERIVNEMGFKELQLEYGPYEEDNVVKLIPPTSGALWEAIKEKVHQRQTSEREKRSRGDIEGGKKAQLCAKKQKIEDKFIDDHIVNNKAPQPQRSEEQKQNGRTAVDIARANVSALASNSTLASLFTSPSTTSSGQDKGTSRHLHGKRNNDLFAR